MRFETVHAVQIWNTLSIFTFTSSTDLTWNSRVSCSIGGVPAFKHSSLSPNIVANLFGMIFLHYRQLKVSAIQLITLFLLDSITMFVYGLHILFLQHTRALISRLERDETSFGYSCRSGTWGTSVNVYTNGLNCTIWFFPPPGYVWNIILFAVNRTIQSIPT